MSGALLLVAKADRQRLPLCRVSEVEGKEVLSIDWVHSEPAGLLALQQRASLRAPGAVEIKKSLVSYCNSESASPEWKSNTKRLLDLASD